MTPLELAANVITAGSIWLSARNNVHTWAIGIVGCTLFGFLFFESRLYADVTLQVFFVATSMVGWYQWRHAKAGAPAQERPITSATAPALAWMGLAALVVTVGYGALLHRYTDAWMPYVDSAVLALSVVAQCLLMQRQIQTWPIWIAVNTLSVPLYASRDLWLTAALYSAYWFNAWYGWWRWRRELRAALSPSAVPA